jgi:hypothetical protein
MKKGMVDLLNLFVPNNETFDVARERSWFWRKRVRFCVLGLLHVCCMLQFIALRQKICSVVCLQTWHALQKGTAGRGDKYFTFLPRLYMICNTRAVQKLFGLVAFLLYEKEPRDPPSWQRVVARLSQSWQRVVARLRQSWQRVVARLRQSCQRVVARLRQSW